MNALNHKYYGNYENFSCSESEIIFDELYQKSRIRVLKQPVELDFKDDDEKLQEVVVKVNEPLYVNILNILFVIGIVAVAVFVLSYLVTRHAEINKLQYQNSDIRKEIATINKQKDICLLQKENTISMENLEKYAIEELDMIKSEQGNILIIEEAIDSRIIANVKFKK